MGGFVGLIASVQPWFKVLAPNRHDSPANVDTSIRALYLKVLVLLAYVRMYDWRVDAWLAVEHGSDPMSKEKNNRNGVAALVVFPLYFDAAV